MKFLDKIKNALFEIEEEPETEEIAKKIDVSRTVEEDRRRSEPISPLKIEPEETLKGPIIFDDEDFMSETNEVKVETKKIDDKVLYGGYGTKESIKEKEKFYPSPVISPVYGVLNKNYTKEDAKTKEKKSLDHLFVEERKKKIDLDMIRQKAYGDLTTEISKNFEPIEETYEEEHVLLYEMQNKEDTPGIEKVSIADAEEYFDDLGLEYNIDYKDLAKEKMTRTKKNKELQEEIENHVIPPKEVEDDFEEEEIEEEPDEKNLYDLIDMMYEDKE